MIKCINYTSYKNKTLVAFVDFHIESWGVDLLGCKLHIKDGRRWLNLPSREIEKNGEKMFYPIIRFKSKEHNERFIEMAKKAIDEYCMEHGDNKI